jgi:pSer/pThr/pTyr-binding forkhead associated (FHA) protein
LVLIDEQGRQSESYALTAERVDIGADTACDIPLTDALYLAALHCRVERAGEGGLLHPVDRDNGVYLRLTTVAPLEHGDVVRIGQEVLRYERLDRLEPEHNADGQAELVGWTPPESVWGRLCQVGMAREVANAYLLGAPDVFLGRERGDILFPRDGFVSASHAVLSWRDGQCYIKDLGSSNGTFIQLNRSTPLRDGDLFLLGRNLLRFDATAAT